MEIYTKLITDVSGQTSTEGKIWDTIRRIFDHAANVLGNDWHTTLDDATAPASRRCELIFTDPIGHGTYGWRMWSNEADYTQTTISNGIHTNVGGIRDIGEPLINADAGAITGFTSLVWKTSGGSVGMGCRGNDGLYKTWFMLIKFNGKYDGTDVYGVACNNGDNGYGPIMVHGTTDINLVNHCHHGAIGSGVYLHPLFDPVSGLVSTDVFGVQSMGSAAYAYEGTIVKQGGASYLSALGGPKTYHNEVNTLFVKM